MLKLSRRISLNGRNKKAVKIPSSIEYHPDNRTQAHVDGWGTVLIIIFYLWKAHAYQNFFFRILNILILINCSGQTSTQFRLRNAIVDLTLAEIAIIKFAHWERIMQDLVRCVTFYLLTLERSFNRDINLRVTLEDRCSTEKQRRSANRPSFTCTNRL